MMAQSLYAESGPGVPTGAARLADYAMRLGWSAHIGKAVQHTDGRVVRLTLVHGPWPSEISMEIQVNWGTKSGGKSGYNKRDHVFYRHGRGPWQQMICSVEGIKDLIARHKLPTAKAEPRYQGPSPGSLRTFRGRR